MRWIAFALGVAGCNQVYGLDETKPVSNDLPDKDADGIPDLLDNCPDVANDDQSDADLDRRGDRCDACPLIPGAPPDDGDDDHIGDFCDPHPFDRRDCLVLVETFSDPAAFASHWTLRASEPASTVSVVDGAARMQVGGDGQVMAITENSISGIADVIMIGSHDLADMSVVSVVSGFQSLNVQYYGCEMFPPSFVKAVGPGFGFDDLVELVPSTPVNSRIAMRLIVEKEAMPGDPTSPYDVRCRVDYGVAVAAQTQFARDPLSGPAGVRVAGGTGTPAPVLIDAIAITQLMDTCSTTIYR